MDRHGPGNRPNKIRGKSRLITNRIADFDRRRLAWTARCSPGSVCTFKMFRAGHVGEGARELAQTIKHDAAIHVSIRKSWISLDRQVEIGERAGVVAIAIREN